MINGCLTDCHVYLSLGSYRAKRSHWNAWTSGKIILWRKQKEFKVQSLRMSDLVFFRYSRDFQVLKEESGLKESLVHRFPFYILIPWLLLTTCFPFDMLRVLRGNVFIVTSVLSFLLFKPCPAWKAFVRICHTVKLLWAVNTLSKTLACQLIGCGQY